MNGKKALIVVDVQRDFVTGSLAVPGAEEIISGIEDECQKPDYDYVIETGDWHPKNHCSFKENGGIWPEHCVIGEYGADFLFELFQGGPAICLMWLKGMNTKIDSYSAFYDNNKNPFGFTQYLKSLDISDVVICGLAFDYCVKFTALDAKKEGFNVTVIKNLCKAVDPKELRPQSNTLVDLLMHDIIICENI